MSTLTFVGISLVLVALTVVLSEYSRRTAPKQLVYTELMAEEEAQFHEMARAEAEYRLLHRAAYTPRTGRY